MKETVGTHVPIKNFRDSKVLVTGGAGFIGANLIRRLLVLHAEVRATLHHAPPRIIDDKIEYVRADLTSAEECSTSVKDIDYVFMCAAQSGGAASLVSDPLRHVTANIVMTSRMLEAAHKAGVKKFVLPSSPVGYPPTGNRPVREDEFMEGDPFDLYFGVGWTSRYTEILCRTYSERTQRRMTTVVVRPSTIFGPLDDFSVERSHVIPSLVRKVVERQDPITVWGDGRDVRDVIYVDDFIDAFLLAAQQIEEYRPLNIGMGRGYSVRHMLGLLLELDNYEKARIRFDHSMPSTLPVRILNINLAKKAIGFLPRTSLEDGLNKTLRWYRDFRSSQR